MHVDSHIDPHSKIKVHNSVLINVKISNPIDVLVDLRRAISVHNSMQINTIFPCVLMHLLMCALNAALICTVQINSNPIGY